jgi:omega-amidase
MLDLTVTIVQTDLHWQDIDANLDMFTTKLDRVDSLCDLILLPEMFSTGFSMEAAALAEPMEGKAVRWLRHQARIRGIDMAGSLMIVENGRYLNRLVWGRPDGSLVTYDKKHLFRYAGEHKVYTAGDKHLSVALKGWRIRPFICYDLRFPVWCRNLNGAYDLAFFVANWPARRSLHWKTLLRARAIENQAFIIGVNRVGTDGNGFEYSGDSAAIDPMGTVLFEQSWKEQCATLRLERNILEDYRAQFPAWKDADNDMVRACPADSFES